MRDIEFKVWNGNRFEDVEDIHFGENIIYSGVAGRITAWHNLKFLIQYTGFKDKNDEKIYEDFIYKSLGHNLEQLDDKDELYLIVFEDGKFFGKRIKNNKAQNASLQWIADHCIKVGSKYENPELIKE